MNQREKLRQYAKNIIYVLPWEGSFH